MRFRVTGSFSTFLFIILLLLIVALGVLCALYFFFTNSCVWSSSFSSLSHSILFFLCCCFVLSKFWHVCNAQYSFVACQISVYTQIWWHGVAISLLSFRSSYWFGEMICLSASYWWNCILCFTVLAKNVFQSLATKSEGNEL